MYVPPPASTVLFRFGSSWAAQRGCWKLFQETPTVQGAPALAATLAAVLAVALAAGVLEHAARTPRQRRSMPPIYESTWLDLSS